MAGPCREPARRAVARRMRRFRKGAPRETCWWLIRKVWAPPGPRKTVSWTDIGWRGGSARDNPRRPYRPSSGVQVMSAGERSGRTQPSLVVLFRAMRPRHWIKNVLVFAAPLAAGQLFDLEVVVQASGAFVAFCLAASAVYLVNDVRDVDEDRAHPTKRFRPVAAGELSATSALLAAVLVGATALIVGAAIEPGLFLVIAAYLALSLLYSAALKDEPIFDLAIVAAGFLLRAMSGGVAASIPLSQWFLLTAAFGSLFMVTGKRFSEVELVGEGNNETRRSLDRYSLGYLRSVWTLAATMTVATYSLWAFEMTETFQRPVLAQLSIAPFTLGLLRYIATIDRGNTVDPVETVLRDRGLLLLGLIWLGLFATGVTGV